MNVEGQKSPYPLPGPIWLHVMRRMQSAAAGAVPSIQSREATRLVAETDVSRSLSYHIDRWRLKLIR